MITTDKGIRYQQNLSGRAIAILFINTNDWTRIRKSQTIIVEALEQTQSGGWLEVKIPVR